MTTELAVEVQSDEVHAKRQWSRRRWRATIFAPSGDGSTRRRASDAFRLGLALLIVVVGSLIVRANSQPELRLENFLHSAPQGIKWVVTTVWYAGSLGVIARLLLIALVFRRATVARNAALAGGLAWLTCGIAGWLLGADGGPPSSPPPGPVPPDDGHPMPSGWA
ncbi:MAG TPA: hypothetical protein VHU17_15045 [Acidimicrobiales bacterium]|nr:hypothetical protein [Acidimicrobiales bacterium]